MLERFAPALFVLLWSTGWIVAKYAAPHADPLIFLSVRFALSLVSFFVFCRLTGAVFPRDLAGYGRAIWSGLFLHGLYLGGLWWAIAEGVPASLSGLIAALQPLLTAMAAAVLLGERLSPVQKLGLGLGFLGLAVAIGPKFLGLDPAGLAHVALPLAVNLLSMVSVTYGTIYQKRRLQSGDIRAIATLQYAGGMIVTVPLVFLLGESRFDMSGPLLLNMGWSVYGLSMGAIGLLLYLIRRGQVSRAATLIYLVPPVVAMEAALLFDEPLTPAMLLGTAIVVVGVYLTNRRA